LTRERKPVKFFLKNDVRFSRIFSLLYIRGALALEIGQFYFDKGMNNKVKDIKNLLENVTATEAISGAVIVKLSSGGVVHTEVRSRIFPPTRGTVKDGIHVELCVRLLEKLTSCEKFFGEVEFSILRGRIFKVNIKQVYKESDIREICNGENTVYGKTSF